MQCMCVCVCACENARQIFKFIPLTVVRSADLNTGSNWSSVSSLKDTESIHILFFYFFISNTNSHFYAVVGFFFSRSFFLSLQT